MRMMLPNWFDNLGKPFLVKAFLSKRFYPHVRGNGPPAENFNASLL